MWYNAAWIFLFKGGFIMTDKELLELAAKAAGFIGAVTEYPNGFVEMSLTNHFNPHGSNIWNPLTDDGDALRLAVKLKIDTKHYNDYLVCWFDGGYVGTGKIYYDDDPYTATRRAITRAAAEIGRAL